MDDLHTPGPWWFDNNEGYGANNVYSASPIQIGRAEIVASIPGDSARAEATARIIASAPDFLRLARDVLPILDSVGTSDAMKATINIRHVIDVATQW